MRNRCVKVKTRKKKEGSKEASPDPHREVSAQALPTRAPPLRTVRALRADADVASQLLHGAVPDSLLVGGQPLRELDLRSLSGGGSHGPAAPHRAVPCRATDTRAHTGDVTESAVAFSLTSSGLGWGLVAVWESSCAPLLHKLSQ